MLSEGAGGCRPLSVARWQPSRARRGRRAWRAPGTRATRWRPAGQGPPRCARNLTRTLTVREPILQGPIPGCLILFGHEVLAWPNSNPILTLTLTFLRYKELQPGGDYAKGKGVELAQREQPAAAVAAARDEVEEEHQQALERAKQRRAGAHAEKRAWREGCVRPSGALSRIPRRTRADPHARPLLLRPTQASALLQPGRAGCRRGRGARWARRGRHVLHGIGSRRSDRKAGRSPRQVASAGAGAVLSLPTARCWRARGALPVQARAGTGAQGADVTSLFGISGQLFSSHGVDRCAHLQ